jgi:phosphatidylethanolamine-binding protein (PEBP) family uncharacterized protein
MRKPPKLLGFAALALLASSHAALAFSASFSWAGIKACGGKSPAFAIRDGPKDTERLQFTLHDKDAPNFHHGGGAVAYSGGGSVPEGAIDYIGPCPPAGAIHRYVWTIEALDSTGKILAHTTAEGRFPAP